MPFLAKWRKSKLAIDYDLFANQSKVVREMVTQAKSEYYSEKVCAAETDQKAMFQIVDKLLHSSQETSLPTHDSLKHLCDSFGIFLQDKISKIRIELDRRAALAADSQPCQAVNTITSLASLKPVQTSDITKIIGKSPNKTCGLDRVPTCIIRQLPIIADIINTSIALSAVPPSLKEA